MLCISTKWCLNIPLNNLFFFPYTIRDGLLCQGGNPLFNETGSGLIGAITEGVGDDSGSQVLASNIGVQGQVFTVVNDEDYYYPNLIDGMLVDEARGLGQGKCVVLLYYWSYFLSCSNILTCYDHFLSIIT